MKVKFKIVVVTAIPLLILLLMAARILLTQFTDYQTANLMGHNINMMTKTGELVAVLQKERGTSSILVSGDSSVTARLDGLRNEADQKNKDFSDSLALAQVDIKAIENAKVAIGLLKSLRSDVDLKKPAGEIIPRYTALIAALLELQRSAIKGKTSFGLGKQMSNLVILSQAQEYAGQFRATLSGILTKDAPLDASQVYRISFLYGSFLANLNSPALILANAKLQSDLIESSEWKEVSAIYVKVMAQASAGNFATNGKDFFDTITKVIDGVISIVDNEKVVITNQIEKIKNDNMKAFTLTSMLVAIFSLLLVGFTIYQGRSITTPLYNIATSLKESSETLHETSSGLSAASSALSESSTTQAAALEETTSSLEEMNGILQQSVSNANQSHALAEGIKDISVDSAKKTADLIEAMKDILKSNEKIQDFSKLVSQIGEKTKVIDEIVFQTKLLSFNASVEAERAGEHGRGFAVVAQEVGNLAQMSGKAAKEISEIVRQSILDSENIAKSNKNSVDVGHDKAKEVATQINHVLEKSLEMAANSQHILDSSKEQAQGIDQIAQAMNQLDQANQKNAQKSAETSDASIGLANQAKSLKDVVDHLVEMV